jgi:hypothetical protein
MSSQPDFDPPKHNRVLLHALQTAHPVLYEGHERFIQVVRYELIGSEVETAVYLTGSPSPLAGRQLTLATRIDQPESAPAAPERTR